MSVVVQLGMPGWCFTCLNGALESTAIAVCQNTCSRHHSLHRRFMTLWPQWHWGILEVLFQTICVSMKLSGRQSTWKPFFFPQHSKMWKSLASCVPWNPTKSHLHMSAVRWRPAGNCQVQLPDSQLHRKHPEPRAKYPALQIHDQPTSIIFRINILDLTNKFFLANMVHVTSCFNSHQSNANHIVLSCTSSHEDLWHGLLVRPGADRIVGALTACVDARKGGILYWHTWMHHYFGSRKCSNQANQLNK